MSLLKIPGLLCYNACIAAALANLEMPFGYLFSSSFHLKYYENDIRNKAMLGDRFKEGDTYYIGTCISTGENDSGRNIYVLNAEKYFNMHVEKLETNDIDILRSELEKGNIVGISTSTFWCKWLPGYQKEDIYHMVLVNKVSENGQIECADSMQSTKYTYMDYQTFKKGVNALEMFSFEPCRIAPDIILWESINGIQTEYMQKDFKRLINDIETTTDFASEFNLCENGFWSCDLYRNLHFYIGGSRILYSIFLDTISKELNREDILLISKQVLDIASHWSALKSLFFKNYYIQNFEYCRKELVKRLKRIAEEEFDICERLKKIS